MCIPKYDDEPLRIPQAEWVFEEQDLEAIEQDRDLDEAWQDFMPYFNDIFWRADEPVGQPAGQAPPPPPQQQAEQHQPQANLQQEEDRGGGNGFPLPDEDIRIEFIPSHEDVLRMERHITERVGYVESLVARRRLEAELREIMDKYNRYELTVIHTYSSLIALDYDVLNA